MIWIKFSISIILMYSDFQAVICVTSSDIVNAARSYIGSTKWSYKSAYSGKPNWDKYSLFVYDVLKGVNAKQPEWEWWIYTPYGPAEWGNSKSAELIQSACWSHCGNNRKAGDVISDGSQVGFVTGFLKSTRATKTTIEESNWGFRSPPQLGSADSITGCWRYGYTTINC